MAAETSAAPYFRASRSPHDPSLHLPCVTFRHIRSSTKLRDEETHILRSSTESRSCFPRKRSCAEGSRDILCNLSFDLSCCDSEQQRSFQFDRWRCKCTGYRR